MDISEQPVPLHIWGMTQICPRCNGRLYRSGNKAVSLYLHDNGERYCDQKIIPEFKK